VEIQAERARRDFKLFVRDAWHVLEPQTQFVPGWHLDAIGEHLEAVERGQIRNLIINIPPGHMKSLLTSVFFPCWVWTRRPQTRWLCASYAESLALRDSLKCRRLIQSPWYQERWGHVFQLAGDQNQKGRFENDQTGYRLAVGVGGAVTGERGDFLICDDPHKALEAGSEAALDTTLEWWDNTWSTRSNNPRTVAKVLIMQRLSERDVAGHVLDKMAAGGEQWETLILPAEYEPTTHVTALGWRDPRQEPGELLWPQLFGPAEIAALKATMTEQGVAGQLQQRPAPAGGAIYKREWWDGVNRYDAGDARYSRRAVGRWISIDTAFKTKRASDFSGFGVYDLSPEYRLLVREATRAKLEFPDLLAEIERLVARWNQDGKLQGIIIEDKASGISALQTLKAMAAPALAKLLIPFEPPGDKPSRGRQASAWCQRGMVWLPQPGDAAPWLYDFEGELFVFPAAAHDDMADTLSQIVLYLEHYLQAGWQAIVRGMMAGAEEA